MAAASASETDDISKLINFTVIDEIKSKTQPKAALYLHVVQLIDKALLFNQYSTQILLKELPDGTSFDDLNTVYNALFDHYFNLGVHVSFEGMNTGSYVSLHVLDEAPHVYGTPKTLTDSANQTIHDCIQTTDTFFTSLDPTKCNYIRADMQFTANGWEWPYIIRAIQTHVQLKHSWKLHSVNREYVFTRMPTTQKKRGGM